MSVHLVRLRINNKNQFAGEAFVTFANADNIESALRPYGKKIHGKYIKIFRSSTQQLQNYCDTTPEKSLSRQNGRVNSVPNLGEDFNQLLYSSFSLFKNNNELFFNSISLQTTSQRIIIDTDFMNVVRPNSNRQHFRPGKSQPDKRVPLLFY